MSKPLAIDLFCGLGGWTSGLLIEGYDCIGFDIERHQYGEMKYPAQLVVQDVLTLHGSQFRNASLIVASPPCFVMGTLILTGRGMIAIPDVIAGDVVLTHRNRWRRVVRTGSCMAPTVIAYGYGATLEGTADHPIYVRRDMGSFHKWSKQLKLPEYYPKSLGAPEWVALAESAKCHWGSPMQFDSLPLPPMPNSLPDTPEFWWMIGRWVGDGWTRRRTKSGSGDEVIICCGRHEASALHDRLSLVAPRLGSKCAAGELHWRRSEERTTVRFTAASNSLAEWLDTNFGRGAAMKGFPSWSLVMSLNNRRALLDGYVSADGNRAVNGNRNIIKTTSVSKRLAIGTRFLAASLGYTSANHYTVRPATCKIEGRTVNQRDTWNTTWSPSSEINRLVETGGGMQWGSVRKILTGQKSTRVWNIEVEEDNSYVADGVVVHNCQEFSYMAMPWSLAKAKAADIRADTTGEKLADLTRLFDACFRIQKEASIAAGRRIPMVVENVRGAIPWVGRSRFNFGSFHLWGDVPALMPIGAKRKSKGMNWSDRTKTGQDFTRIAGQQGMEDDGIKCGGDWFNDSQPSISRLYGSKSPQRKMASAMIAKIPLVLSRHIAATYRD